MIINHNISAMNAHRMLVNNAEDTGKVLEKLSSGVRINRGADDAAGLSVSEKMRSQIRGLNMAHRNAQDGVSLIQTAEGYLQETSSALQRMRELSVQAANGVYTQEDRGYIQTEVKQLLNEVERIAKQAEFNGKLLFVGNYAAAGATTASGAPLAPEAAPPKSDEEKAASIVGMPLHIGPNVDQRIFITINRMTTDALELANGKAVGTDSSVSDEPTKVVPGIDLTNTEGANLALTKLDTAIKYVNSERTRLGAYQNRLETAMRGISVASENLQASESRIRDTDMAKEMIDFVKLNILGQSSTSMLAQANLRPQLILRVLG